MCRLEREPSAETDAALAAGRAGDLAEVVARGGAVAAIGVRPPHRVRHVERVHPELRVARATELEALEQRAVELPEAGAPGTGVAGHVALHTRGRLRVRGGIEIQPAGTELTDDPFVAHLTRESGVARRVQRGAIGRDVQRRAGLRDKERADL